MKTPCLLSAVFLTGITLAAAAPAATVCKSVDAAGHVRFGDCNGPRAASNAQQVEVSAPRTGASVATPAQKNGAPPAATTAPVPQTHTVKMVRPPGDAGD